MPRSTGKERSRRFSATVSYTHLLERETLRNGKKLTQRDFVLNLITQALDEADAENAAEQNAPTEAPVAPRVADVTAPANTDTPDEDNAV